MGKHSVEDKLKPKASRPRPNPRRTAISPRPMPSSRSKQCNQPLVEIDHWGERLTGCSTCNRWQATTGEWCRLAPDDIMALRALKEVTLRSEEQT